MSKILLIDDEPSFLATLNALLKKQNHNVTALNNGEKALEAIGREIFDLVLTDIRMTPVSGLDVLNVVQEVQPQTPVIMITGDDSIESAAQSMRIGAFDYVTKPFKVDELFLAVKRALEYHEIVLDNIFMRNQLESRYHLDNIVAFSANMCDVCKIVECVAPTNAPVLITGEKGTGKNLVAKSIHLHSERSKEPFVIVDCESISSEILEVEMFGAVEGFGDQNAAEKTGVFDAADRGTIFIDEIGRLPIDMQQRLAAVMKEKRIKRVGGLTRVAVDVRIIAASSRPLEKMAETGKFSKELFALLAMVPIRIDPLRDRPEDLIPLVSYFIQQEIADGEETPLLDRMAKKTLEAYHWPGNVRELENAMHCAMASNCDNVISRDDLPANVNACAQLSDHSSSDSVRGKSLKAFLRQKEREYVADMVKRMNGDREKAAQALNISLGKLDSKLGE